MTPRPLLYACVGILFVLVMGGVLMHPPSADAIRASEPPSLEVWLGTSPYGHNMLPLLSYALGATAAQSLWAAVLTLGISCALGAVAAMTAGRWPDRVISTVSRVLDSLGVLILGICILAVIPSLDHWTLGALLSLIAWPSMSTVIRTEMLSVLQTDYAEAARAIGVGRFRLFRVHVLPAIWPRLQFLFFGVFTGFIAVLAAISFLGAGSASEPTIGSLLYDSLSYLRTAPWFFVECLTALALLLILAVSTSPLLLGPDRR